MDKYTEIRPIVLGVAKRGDKLLVAKGYDCKKNEVFYRALGGGIEFLEKSEDALRREFFEELGIDIEVGEYIGLFENIFEFNGKKAHELVLVYNIKIRDDDYKDEYLIQDDVGEFKALWVDINEFKSRNKIIYPNDMLEILK